MREKAGVGMGNRCTTIGWPHPSEGETLQRESRLELGMVNRQREGMEGTGRQRW
jgi:hypothetical protein